MSEVKRKRKAYNEISEQEKEYRRQWNKENLVSLSIPLNKKYKKEFDEACKILGISQYSVVKNACDETIAKAKQLEEK